MATNFERLKGIAGKNTRLVLGLMSGTSMDGLDVALCEFSGSGINTRWQLLEFVTLPHSPEHQSRVRKVFARADAPVERTAALDQEIAREHGRLVLEALRLWNRAPEEMDLIGSHGQTVYHAPAHQTGSGYPHKNLTVQLGDGDFLARKTGIVTVSDFRRKHIAAGGEGAPLAPYGDLLLFADPYEDRILLNIGGIGNFTFLPSSGSDCFLVYSDTGPGNTIMDAYMRRYFSIPYDQEGNTARSGRIDESLLTELSDDPFFKLSFPRTTGPEVFNLGYLERKLVKSGCSGLSHQDIMCTLNTFTARSILDAIKPLLTDRTAVYISGGGSQNRWLMENISAGLPGIRIQTTNVLGMNPEAKEAVIFALLAHECLFGEPKKYPVKETVLPKITMGKISFPE